MNYEGILCPPSSLRATVLFLSSVLPSWIDLSKRTHFRTPPPVFFSLHFTCIYQVSLATASAPSKLLTYAKRNLELYCILLSEFYLYSRSSLTVFRKHSIFSHTVNLNFIVRRLIIQLFGVQKSFSFLKIFYVKLQTSFGR